MIRKLESYLIQLRQIIQANWKRLLNKPSPIIEGVNIEQYRLSICASCPINDGGTCSKERGGCGCPLASKVKCLDCNCPKNYWLAVKKD